VFEAVPTLCANAAWLASCLPAHLALCRAMKRPEEAQAALLSRLLQANANSAYGKKFGFDRLRRISDFQATVPIVSYDDLKPWVEEILEGKSQVLTTEPVLMLEKTSGSTSAAKYIPYTAALRQEFQRAVRAWIFDLYLYRPALLAGCAYWSITPLARERKVSPGGIPIGFESDTEYFNKFEQFLLRKTLATPNPVARVADLDTSIYVTLRFLLQAEFLTFVSVWNPSFLTLLFDNLQRYGERLLDDLQVGEIRPPQAFPKQQGEQLNPFLQRNPGRAQYLRGLLRSQGRMSAREIWPKLKTISCWADASAKLAIPGLRQVFDNVEIQGKGLLATEGVVSIPLTEKRGAALAVTSHFYEFVGRKGDHPKLAHELERGGQYAVLLTTGGGLWRYELGDIVRVTGFVEKTPLLEFMGKQDGVSDLCGEKLNAVFVGEVLSQLQDQGIWSGPFAMLAPVRDIPVRYTLFLEGDFSPDGLIVLLDQKLRENPHFDYCRRLGQLGGPRVFHIQRGAQATYLHRCRSLGQRIGDVKPTPLHSSLGWEEFFEGGYHSEETSSAKQGPAE
jgi:GH3 auxin-responsive promoter